MKRALRGLEDRTAYWTRWNLGGDGRINPPALSLLVPPVDHWQPRPIVPASKAPQANVPQKSALQSPAAPAASTPTVEAVVKSAAALVGNATARQGGDA